jgi:mannose-6-phosphate isomerase-like protein (cupin superfamily)
MDVKDGRKKARLGLNPYNDWVAREGLIVHEGIACDLLTAETKHWPRLGVNGAAVHLRGRGDFCNLFLIDIPPGASTEPQHHLYEEVMYVVEGRGSCELEFADGRKHSFEWQPTSMFAIPLNATYRLHNGDGKNRAIIGSTTSLPLMMKIFHNDSFIFNNTHFFDDRVGGDEHYTGGGDLTMIRPGSNIWETNFIPDLASIELHAWNERGAGSSNLMFILADSNMHAHCSEIQAGTYKKAHRHGSGRHVFTVTGKGYSLLWFDGETEFTRVDWKPGVVFPPIDGQFHQHFVTSQHASRYMAAGVSNQRYPLTEAQRSASGENAAQGAVATSVKDGGGQIEYEDQDPRIHALWLEEMRKNGITPQFGKYATAPKVLTTAS